MFTDVATLAGQAYLPHQTGSGVTSVARVAATVAFVNTLIADMDALLASDVNYLLGEGAYTYQSHLA